MLEIVPGGNREEGKRGWRSGKLLKVGREQGIRWMAKGVPERR